MNLWRKTSTLFPLLLLCLLPGTAFGDEPTRRVPTVEDLLGLQSIGMARLSPDGKWVAYTVTRADWISRGDMAAIAMWAPSAVRPRTEDVHDLTTTLETEVPLTATRVFVLYKLNSAFAHGDDPTRPALDYRYDVQVNQALPFMPFSRAARWEVLVGMRNLYRDPNDAASVYDELLVVRPPKRLVGGVQVRF